LDVGDGAIGFGADFCGLAGLRSREGKAGGLGLGGESGVVAADPALRLLAGGELSPLRLVTTTLTES